MSCMCGDLCCPSCGPAQGNYKCDACGIWSEDGGCEKPEVCAETIRQMNESEAAYWGEMDKLGEKRDDQS